MKWRIRWWQLFT